MLLETQQTKTFLSCLEIQQSRSWIAAWKVQTGCQENVLLGGCAAPETGPVEVIEAPSLEDFKT